MRGFLPDRYFDWPRDEVIRIVDTHRANPRAYWVFHEIATAILAAGYRTTPQRVLAEVRRREGVARVDHDQRAPLFGRLYNDLSGTAHFAASGYLWERVDASVLAREALDWRIAQGPGLISG